MLQKVGYAVDGKPYQLKKKQSTKEYIAYAFQEILKAEPFDTITVREIAEACDISRTTFYRCFEDKYDLLIWIYTQEIDRIYAGDGDSRQKFIDIFHFMKANRRYFTQALLSDRHNTLEDYIFKLSMENITGFIAKRWQVETLPEELIRSIEFGTAGSIYIWKKWLFSDSDETPEHLADKIIADYPETVRNNFFV